MDKTMDHNSIYSHNYQSYKATTLKKIGISGFLLIMILKKLCTHTLYV